MVEIFVLAPLCLSTAKNSDKLTHDGDSYSFSTKPGKYTDKRGIH